MNASFKEKSVWIRLIGLILALGSYFVIAATMLSKGVAPVSAYVSIFLVAVVSQVFLLVAGHVVVTIFSKPDDGDERDRLIGWRAESNSSWILAAGVFVAITGIVASLDNVWVANLLLFSLFLSEVARCIFQLVYYRRGV